MSEISTVSVLEKTSKQKIWIINEKFPLYGTKKTIYAYDFALIGIREKNGFIRKYCYPSGNADIAVTYQNQHNHYTITINDYFQNQIISQDDIDAILMYFEKDSQALLAISTSATFKKTGIFINSVYGEDIPSLREEAMTFAYIMDNTKGIFQLFDNNPYEREHYYE